MNNLRFSKTKKVYFASDQHFGAPSLELSKIREKKFLNWLDYIEKDVGALFLLGDLFDFWFEYKTVVPKGFTSCLLYTSPSPRDRQKSRMPSSA